MKSKVEVAMPKVKVTINKPEQFKPKELRFCIDTPEDLQTLRNFFNNVSSAFHDLPGRERTYANTVFRTLEESSS